MKQCLYLLLLGIIINTACSKEPEPVMIQVITNEVVKTEFGYNIIGTIFLHGNKIQNYGHCWSDINPEPTTTTKSFTQFNIVKDTILFTSEVNNLKESTTYYFRTYTYDGTNYTYGQVLSTKTPAPRDTWESVTTFPNQGREGGFAFTSNQKLYMGAGYDGLNYTNDMWEYDPDKKTWKQIAAFAGGQRAYGVSFTANNIGYAGTGENKLNQFSDFYAYNFNTNTWTKLAKFAYGIEISHATSFVLKNIPYVLTGNFGINLNLFWQYDVAANAWIEKPNFPGKARKNATAAVVKDNAYFGYGENDSEIFDDIWEFSATSELWTLKTKGTVGARTNAVMFSYGQTFFVMGGLNGAAKSDLWRYELMSNQWTQMKSLPGVGRFSHSVINVNGTIYICLGKELTQLSDVYSYLP